MSRGPPYAGVMTDDVLTSAVLAGELERQRQTLILDRPATGGSVTSVQRDTSVY